MNNSYTVSFRNYFAVALLSASIIAYQIVLIQFFSFVQWYHFAYMVISIAMLGFGSAGTFIFLLKKRLTENAEFFIPVFTLLCGLFINIAVPLSQLHFVRFDSFLLFTDQLHIVRLVFTYLIFFLPFFFGAVAIGLMLICGVEKISKLYFANMTGSGLGGLIPILLLFYFLPQDIALYISFIPIIAGIILLQSNSKILILAALVGLSINVLLIFNKTELQLSEFKGISKTLNLPDTKIVQEQRSPYGLIQVVKSPAIRFAPGISLAYSDLIPNAKAVFLNGDWYGAMSEKNILDYTTNIIPYNIKERNTVLILTPVSSNEIIQALAKGTETITVVESNSQLISIIENELNSKLSGDELTKIGFIKTNPRTFIQQNQKKFDLIQLPMLSTFGGGSGLNAMQEQYLFTKEAFTEMLNSLAADGVISVSSWMDYPFRNPLKITATIVETLEENYIDSLQNYFLAVRSWGTISFLIKKSSFTYLEYKEVLTTCDKLFFDPLFIPNIEPGRSTKFNALQDERILDYFESIFSGERNEFYKEYDFNISPSTDNKPYFSQFLKLRSFNHLKESFGDSTVFFFEIGYLIVIITFFQILIAAFILIILPLFKLGFKKQNILFTLLYFGGLGSGFMFLEIILIQRFILYFGNPVFAATAVISFMLICSGLGSYFSERIEINKGIILSTFSIVLMSILYLIGLTPILKLTSGLELTLKIIFAFVIIAPLSFIAGIPFPLGMKKLSLKSDIMLPWAYGINGCLSVIATVLATIVSVEIGFTGVMFFAAGFYFISFASNFGVKQ